MTKDEALLKLHEAKNNPDTELAHCDADDVLCELLVELGYGDVVDAFHQVKKWYA